MNKDEEIDRSVDTKEDMTPDPELVELGNSRIRAPRKGQ